MSDRGNTPRSQMAPPAQPQAAERMLTRHQRAPLHSHQAAQPTARQLDAPAYPMQAAGHPPQRPPSSTFPTMIPVGQAQPQYRNECYSLQSHAATAQPQLEARGDPTPSFNFSAAHHLAQRPVRPGAAAAAHQRRRTRTLLCVSEHAVAGVGACSSGPASPAPAAMDSDQFWPEIKAETSSTLPHGLSTGAATAFELFRRADPRRHQLAQQQARRARCPASRQQVRGEHDCNEPAAHLQQDANRQREQAQAVVAAQQQAQQQAVSLTSDLRSSSNELDQVTQRIRALEAQQANPELVLPPDAADAAAPAEALQQRPNRATDFPAVSSRRARASYGAAFLRLLRAPGGDRPVNRAGAASPASNKLTPTAL
ncbi:MAG: hypothetical protein WDW36_009568 [Sanguina aurantia]